MPTYAAVDGYGTTITSGSSYSEAYISAQRWTNAHNMAAEVFPVDGSGLSETIEPEIILAPQR